MTNLTLTPVKAVSPVAPYLGGKKNLAKVIISHIDSIEHGCYAEPFIGMGGVFMRRKSRPEAEVINDINKEIATFFRILQRHYPQFIEMMRFQLTVRNEFERLTKTNPETLTDLERAARFIYLQRTVFGGMPNSKSFGTATCRSGRFDISKLEPMLEDLHIRLAGVVIECLPYDKFITRYDRPHTLYYMDPPYFNHEADYGKDIFSADDFETIARLMRESQSKFILSINDVPEIREIFASFTMHEVETNYSAGGNGNGKNKKAKELIIIKGGAS